MKHLVLAQILFSLSWLLMPCAAISFADDHRNPSLPNAQTPERRETREPAPPLAGLQLDVQSDVVKEREYLAAIGQDIYTLRETNRQLRGRYAFGADEYLSLAWQETAIEQKNELFGDTDFSVESQGPVLGFGSSFLKNATLNAELRVEEYQDASSDAFYTLDGSHAAKKGMGGKGVAPAQEAEMDYFFSGFVETKFTRDRSWTTFGYNRTRDTEPLYNKLNNRAELNIRVKELTGIASGWQLNPAWEIAGSVYYEHYETGTPDQFNFNGEISYRPRNHQPLHFAVGSGYYTEERETIVNFQTDYLLQWKYADLSLQYQCEYSQNEDSVLHEGDAILKFYLNQKASLVLSGKYGEETGGDRDRSLSFNAGLEFLF